jgi:hypothetical protein
MARAAVARFAGYIFGALRRPLLFNCQTAHHVCWRAHVIQCPVFIPASGHAGLLIIVFRFSPARGVRNDWAVHRARGAICFWQMAATCLAALWLRARLDRTRQWLRMAQPPRKQETTRVPHATILSACNSQRRHALGALTECLASPHCWVLGPPTSTTDRQSFHDLAKLASSARSAQKGPWSRRVRRIPLHAGDETGAPLGRSGTVNR